MTAAAEAFLGVLLRSWLCRQSAVVGGHEVSIYFRLMETPHACSARIAVIMC